MSLYDKSLLERLDGAAETPPGAAAPFDKSTLLSSVLGNLRRVLNARRGCCETRIDYGLPDLNDVLGRGGNPAILAGTVQETIEMFEPRLSAVMARFMPDPDHPMRINFRISATLHFGGTKEHVAFDTILSEDKRIHVRG
jgi:type VI secretion system protein